jgi:hypothetical protein
MRHFLFVFFGVVFAVNAMAQVSSSSDFFPANKQVKSEEEVKVALAQCSAHQYAIKSLADSGVLSWGDKKTNSEALAHYTNRANLYRNLANLIPGEDSDLIGKRYLKNKFEAWKTITKNNPGKDGPLIGKDAMDLDVICNQYTKRPEVKTVILKYDK